MSNAGILPSLPGETAAQVSGHAAESLQLLDDEPEWSNFSRRSANDMAVWESSLVIEGMHCAACSLTVEEALLRVPGVLEAQVNSASRRALVRWDAGAVLPSRWMQAVQDAGYRAVPANDTFALDRRRLETRAALWRWLVAGLCMMQVMMYAYPAYIARSGELSAEIERLLRWASWLLTLPVMIFSCGPFFRSALRDISRRTIGMDLPVALGIGMTFLASTAGTFDPAGMFGREVYFDSLTMFVFFLLTGRWLELRLRDRTAGALESLMNRLPDSVERRGADGGYVRIAVRRIGPGDVLRIRPGEAFAADGLVVTGTSLVDEALLTGESRALERAPGSEVIAGSHNLTATIEFEVRRVGSQTRFAQIVAMMESASVSRPQIAVTADRLARPFLVGVMLAAALACAWWWNRDPGHALMVAVSVLIVTCPCALSLATPAALLASAGSLARAGVLVRRLAAFEALATVDTLAFDKTGTLTRDGLCLGVLELRSGIQTAGALEMAAALARHSLHPASIAVVRAQQVQSIGQSAGRWECTAVREEAGRGLAGSLAELQTGRTYGMVRLGSAEFCGIPQERRKSGSCVYFSDASGWLATMELREELRPDAAQTVAQLRAAGVSVHILSGDAALAVQRVAEQAGIGNAVGDLQPEQKLAHLRALQAKGHRVAMVGDGLNDGPVIAGADVSFAFGNAAPLAQARADFVVQGDQLASVATVLLLSRRTLRVVRQNLWWALIYNLACVPLAVLGLLPAWLAGLGMAGSSLLVVLNALRLSHFAARPAAQE